MSKKALGLHMVARTDVGRVRDHNEDNFIVTGNYTEDWIVPNQPYTNSTYGTIMVIADGMGGLNAGEIASKITVESIRDYFTNAGADIAPESTFQQRLADAILYAHQQILAYSEVNSEAEGMGTTVVLVQIVGDTLYAAWSGDSRCYLYRNDTLTQLTKDHSYVQALLDEGKITKEQAFYHPQSNIITQSLGDLERPPSPGTTSQRLYEGDIVLLCSDGLNAMLEDSTIEQLIYSNQTDVSLCNELLIETANNAGGNDNITVIINRVFDGDKNLIVAKKNTENVLPEMTEVVDTDKSKKQTRNALFALLLAVFFGVGTFFGLYIRKANKDEIKPAAVAEKDSTTKAKTVFNSNSAHSDFIKGKEIQSAKDEDGNRVITKPENDPHQEQRDSVPGTIGSTESNRGGQIVQKDQKSKDRQKGSQQRKDQRTQNKKPGDSLEKLEETKENVERKSIEESNKKPLDDAKTTLIRKNPANNK